MAKMKVNSYNVFNYVKEHEEEKITAKDIAAALELDTKQVNGIVTAAFVRHRGDEVDEEGKKIIVPLMERVEGEIEMEMEDGKIKHETVKFIRLTDAGREFEAECE